MSIEFCKFFLKWHQRGAYKARSFTINELRAPLTLSNA